MSKRLLKKPQLFFYGQGVHFALLSFLLVGLATITQDRTFLSGGWAGCSTTFWFWIAVIAPILHQTYVWLCWRAELHYGFLSRILGQRAFDGYALIFFILLFSRLGTTAFLAYANRDSVTLAPVLVIFVFLVAGLPMAYVYYSLIRYMGFRRAAGLDHFDPAFRRIPLLKKGAFKYFRNPLYLFGLLILFVPGLLLLSKAALLVALYQQIYIWVHYFCTEKPDMKTIYGDS